ncbi:hypothetical protein BBJ28_00010459 [Nothophytophthora sp. Chile5]|nr:hypothetical protein BBJ28_00010459 [Nothophytophthora sp. Chile5]
MSSMDHVPEMEEALLVPEDLQSQARRFHVDLGREPFLLLLMKQAATTPMPPKWQHGQGGEAEGDRPEKRYFQDQIEALRQQHEQRDGGVSAWMAFEELVPQETGGAKKRAVARATARKRTTTYYYDFVAKKRQEMHPLVPLVGDYKGAGSGDAHPTAGAADPQVFACATALHQQTSMSNLAALGVLCFHSWWKETSLQGETRQCRLRLYFSIPTRHFQVMLEDSASVFTISHIANPISGAPLSAWDLHEGARLTVLGRITTLRQASLLTRQWLELQERRLRPVLEQLQSQLAKYELRSQGRSAAANERVLCADPHRSRCGVSLRELLNDIASLQAKLASYRPDLARRLCEPLADLDDS